MDVLAQIDELQRSGAAGGRETGLNQFEKRLREREQRNVSRRTKTG